jgi:Putative Flp pilus-assembly TadE/G-like
MPMCRFVRLPVARGSIAAHGRAMLSLPRGVSPAIVRLGDDERGTVAIMVALCAPILFGLAALAIDVASWQVAQKSMQGAADTAVYSAEIASNKADGTSLVTQAKAVTAALGFIDGQNGVSVSVNIPPTSGNYTSNATAIEVIVQQPQPRFLSGLFLSSDPTVKARAVAVLGGSACMLALNTSANQATNISGSGSINAPNCYVVSNSSSSSSINMSGGATVNVACLIAVGTVQTTSNLTEHNCTTPKIHAAPTPDPYAARPEPTPPSGACLTVPSGSSITLSPGNYCSGLTVNGTATFQPGLYYIDGNFSIQGGANATGAGVTFYITGHHNVAISGGSTVNFSAPTTGPTAGIVYFGDRTTTSGNNNFSGGSGTSITGAVYFATQQISYTGGANTGTGCTQLIASTINITGSSSFNNNACDGTGVSTIGVPGLSPHTVALVE